MSGDINPLIMRFLCRRPSAGDTGAWPFSATEERFKLLRAGPRGRNTIKIQPQRQAASERCVLHSKPPPKQHPRLLINPHSACCTQPSFPRVHSLRVFEHRPLRPLDRSAWAGKPPHGRAIR
jgi:hypothetical protein